MSPDTPRPERPKFDAFKAEQPHDPEVRAAYEAAKARPERMTLTDEERALAHFHGEDGERDYTEAAVESILAARERALREEIAEEIEAKYIPARFGYTPHGGYHYAILTALRIVRDEAR